MDMKTTQPWHLQEKFGPYKFFNVAGQEEEAALVVLLAVAGVEHHRHVPLGHLLPNDFGGPVLAAIFPILWFVVKVLSFLLLYIWVRGTLPRFRYDQLMAFGWKFLLPLALANLIATAIGVAW